MQAPGVIEHLQVIDDIQFRLLPGPMVLVINAPGATDQDGKLTAYEYDQNGNQTKITPPESGAGQTTNIYNANDRLQSTTDGAGKTTSYEYNLAGQETTVTLPTGDVKTVSYYNTGRISRIEDASATTDYSYDLQGNAIEQKKMPGTSEYFTYDDANRQIRTVNSQGRIRNEQKDHSGKSTQVIDQNGIVDYRYDAADLLTELKVDGETSTTFGYNKVGARTRQTQANGANTAYLYDENNRLTALDTSTGVGPLLGYSYGYDDKGNITTETAGTDKFVYSYDANSQLTAWGKDESMTVGYEANALPGSSNPTWTVESAGSPGQSVSGGILTTSGNTGSTLTFRRDESGFNATEGTTLEFRFKNSDVFHGTNGALVQIGDGSKLIELRIYPTEVRFDLNQYSLDTYSDYHTYRITLKDGVARLYIDGILRLMPTYNLPSINERFVRFGDMDNINAPSHTEYWDYVRYWSSAPDSAVYDANGNRTKSQNQGKKTSYTYGSDSRLVSSITNGQTTAYGYDASGNLTTQTASGETTTYGWSADNELLAIAGPSKAAAFTYDTEGKRLSKTIAGVTTQFVYDGIKLIAEKDSSGTVTAKYFYDSNGQLVSMKKGGQSYYFHLNHRGDVIKITDASQTVVASYAYDPWGNILESTGTFANQQPFRYASYYWDSEIGMYYLMARYYDPGVGRFVSKDPVVPELGQEGQAYVYVNNNPVNKIDPGGEYPGQSAFDAWRDTTSAEKIQAIKDPSGRKVVQRMAGRAMAKTEEYVNQGKFQRWELNDGRGDAFRHAYWSALATKRIGAARTKAFTDAHENYAGNPWWGKQMDLYNNEEGRKIGKLYKKSNDNKIARIVYGSLKKRLYWVRHAP